MSQTIGRNPIMNEAFNRMRPTAQGLADFMTLDDWMIRNFRASAEEAGDYLRLALAEAVEDPAGLVSAFQQVVAARGGIDDLGFSIEERAELASALGRSMAAALPQAA